MSEPWVWMEELVRVGSIPLSSDEARHLAARRLKVDDSLVVFDGRGHMAEARIESLGKHSSVVAVDSITETARPDSAFVFASVIPKGDRLSTMLQMLPQLGLDSWQPLVLEDALAGRSSSAAIYFGDREGWATGFEASAAWP